MTLRDVWQWIENFVISFLSEFFNRTMSALQMVAEKNFLDWDIGLILYAAFRLCVDFFLMGAVVGLLFAPIFAVLASLFHFLRIEKFHSKIDGRFGYGVGSAIICILWCSSLLIFTYFIGFLNK